MDAKERAGAKVGQQQGKAAANVSNSDVLVHWVGESMVCCHRLVVLLHKQKLSLLSTATLSGMQLLVKHKDEGDVVCVHGVSC